MSGRETAKRGRTVDVESRDERVLCACENRAVSEHDGGAESQGIPAVTQTKYPAAIALRRSSRRALPVRGSKPSSGEGFRIKWNARGAANSEKAHPTCKV